MTRGIPHLNHPTTDSLQGRDLSLLHFKCQSVRASASAATPARESRRMMPHHQRMKGRQRPVDPSTVGLHDPSNLSSNVFKHRLGWTDPRDASPGPPRPPPARFILCSGRGVGQEPEQVEESLHGPRREDARRLFVSSVFSTCLWGTPCVPCSPPFLHPNA